MDISKATQSCSDTLHFYRKLLLTRSNHSLLSVFELTVILILEYLNGRNRAIPRKNWIDGNSNDSNKLCIFI